MKSPSIKSVVFCGKYEFWIVAPHETSPLSAFTFPSNISHKVVLPIPFVPIKAILSPFSTVNEISSNTTSPSYDLEIFLTVLFHQFPSIL